MVKLRSALVVCCERTLESKLAHLMMTARVNTETWEREGREVLTNH